MLFIKQLVGTLRNCYHFLSKEDSITELFAVKWVHGVRWFIILSAGTLVFWSLRLFVWDIVHDTVTMASPLELTISVVVMAFGIKLPDIIKLLGDDPWE